MTSSPCTSRASELALPKGSAAYTAAEAKAQSVFQGTTLRGLLLEAYGFSLIALIALWCAIAAFALAGVMAVLVGLGFAHARRTGDNEELMPNHAPQGTLVSA
jgi:membrane-bound ClpP family serine protease